SAENESAGPSGHSLAANQGAVWVPSPLPIFAEFAPELPPPHTLALSSQCIPAFWQSVRVKGCGAAKAGPKPRVNKISQTKILMYLSHSLKDSYPHTRSMSS